MSRSYRRATRWRPRSCTRRTPGSSSALAYQGHARAAAGDIDDALASAREILGVSRTLGDEPFAVSQLIRMAFDAVAVDVINRTLARGSASEAALAATQKAIADEAAEPLALYASRGERAVMYDVVERLATGKLDVRELSGQKVENLPGGFMDDAFYRGEQTILLQKINQAVAIAKRPLPEQPALIDGWEADLKGARPTGLNVRGSLAYLILPRAPGRLSGLHSDPRRAPRHRDGRWPGASPAR